MSKSKLGIALVVICLTLGACESTKVNVVTSSKSDKDKIAKDLLGGYNPWKKIGENHYESEDGSEVIITDENLWEEVMKTNKKIFPYPTKDYYTGEDTFLIPKEALDTLPSYIRANAKYYETKANLFSFLNNIDITDISFIGILQLWEHESLAYEMKNGTAYFHARADEPLVWGSPRGGNFDRGKKVNMAVIVEE